MTSSTILKTGAIICGLTVIIGAFGAHALKPILEANDRVSPFETGVLYQMFHGLAILAAGIIALYQQPIALIGNVPDPRPEGYHSALITATWIQRAFWCFLIGVVLFSGSLYGLAIFPKLWWLGPVTPIGGIFFVGGWISLWIGIKSK